MKGMRRHLLGVALTFIAAVLFMLMLKGMLSPKPPFVVGHPPAAAADSSTAATPAAAPPAEHSAAVPEAGPDSARVGLQSDGTWPPVPIIDTGLHNLPRGADEPAAEAVTARDEEFPGADTPAEDTAPTPPAEEPQLARLVRVYEKMRPKQVAQVFDSLPDEQTVAMLSKMNDRAAAKVIAAMDPTNAARLSQMLVRTGMP